MLHDLKTIKIDPQVPQSLPTNQCSLEYQFAQSRSRDICLLFEANGLRNVTSFVERIETVQDILQRADQPI